MERASLKSKQSAEARGLEDRVRIQTLEADRQHKALARVKKRELVAFMRDQRAEARIQARGSDDHAPSLVELLDPAIRTGSDAREVAPDLLRSFGKAKPQRDAGPPDLLAAFERAAGDAPRGRVREDLADLARGATARRRRSAVGSGDTAGG